MTISAVNSSAGDAGRTSQQDPSLLISRELSWLAFNERVLALAWDETHPLLERARFM